MQTIDLDAPLGEGGVPRTPDDDARPEVGHPHPDRLRITHGSASLRALRRWAIRKKSGGRARGEVGEEAAEQRHPRLGTVHRQLPPPAADAVELGARPLRDDVDGCRARGIRSPLTRGLRHDRRGR